MGAKLLFAFLAAATSCHTHYYGTSYDLSTKGRVIAWPVDENGEKFRYTIDHIPKPIREGRIYALAVGNSPIRGELPEPVDSVLVVLPPEAAPAQRKSAERVVDWVVGQDGGAAAHIIVGFEPWTFVLNLGQLEQSLAKLEERTADRLGKHGNRWVEGMVEAALVPSFIVVPVERRRGRFAIAQIDLCEGRHEVVAHAKTAEDAADYALANYVHTPFEEFGIHVPPTVHFIMAHDASQALRDECVAAAQRLSNRNPAGADRPFMVVFRTTSLSQAELNRKGAIERLAKSGELLSVRRRRRAGAE